MNNKTTINIIEAPTSIDTLRDVNQLLRRHIIELEEACVTVRCAVNCAFSDAKKNMDLGRSVVDGAEDPNTFLDYQSGLIARTKQRCKIIKNATGRLREMSEEFKILKYTNIPKVIGNSYPLEAIENLRLGAELRSSREKLSAELDRFEKGWSVISDELLELNDQVKAKIS